MRTFKKFVSLFLSLTLLVSCMGLPAFAAADADYELAVLNVQKMDGSYDEESATITEAGIGDVIVVSIGFKNNTAEDKDVSGFSAFLNYDNEVLEPFSGTQPFRKNPYAINAELTGDWGWSQAGDVKTDIGQVSLASAGSDPYLVAAGEELVFARIAFKVSEDVESGDISFSFDENADNLVEVPSGDAAIELGAFEEYDFTIKGNPPRLSDVEFSDEEVVANGKDDVVQQATAVSTKDKDITSAVTWSVSPADKGVTIDASGKISVDAKAVDGDYTITATPKSGLAIGETIEKTLTVKREAPVAQSVEVSGYTGTYYMGEERTLDKAYVAEITTQYGDVYAAQDVKWSVEPANQGVSIDANGMVTIHAGAEQWITAEYNDKNSMKPYTIIAEVDGVEGELELGIHRSSYLDDINVYVDGEEASSVTITIPEAGKTEEVDFEIELKDQFHEDMDGMYTFRLKSGQSFPAGVSLDETTIVVAGNDNPTDANTGTFVMEAYAKIGNSEALAEVTVNVTTITADWSVVKPDMDLVYGVTNGAAIVLPPAPELRYTLDGENWDTLIGSWSVVDADEVPDAGKATITVEFKVDDVASNYESYRGKTLTTTVEAEIAPKDLADGVTVDPIPNEVYTLFQHKPEVTVKNGGKVLVKNTDYTVEYENNVFAGIASVIMTGKGNYTGTLTQTFVIDKTVLEDLVISMEVSNPSVVYTGEAQEAGLHMTAAGIGPNDYGMITIKYNGSTEAPTDVGTYTVTLDVTEGENCYATADWEIGTFTITPKSISGVTVSGFNANGYEYTGAEITPAVTVKDGETTLVDGTDYTVAYSNNINYGTATVTVTGEGNYTGTKTATFTITKKQPVKGTDYVMALPNDTVYTGEAVTADVEKISDIGAVTIKYNGSTTAPVNAGTYAVTVDIAESTNFAAMTGVEIGSFKILPKSISGVTVEGLNANGYEYTGAEIKPVVTVKDGEKTLVNGTDYTVAYSDNTNVGTAAITITGKGNYGETKAVSFEITKKQPVKGTDYTVTLPNAPVYNGEAQAAVVNVTGDIGAVTVKYNGSTTAPVNAGTYAVTVDIAASANYAEMTAVEIGSFTIAPKSVAGMTVEGLNPNGYEYNGEAHTPAVTVKDGETTLVKDTDYEVAYSNNVNYGTATITITGKGNYGGTKTVTFTVTKKQPVKGTDYTVTLPETPVYTGEDQAAVVNKVSDIGNVTVKYNGSTTAPVNAGTYAVTVDIAESANFAAMTGIEIGSFTIAKADIAITGAAVAEKVYNGALDDAKVTEVTFSGLVNNETLVMGTDYTVSGVYAHGNAGDAVDVTVTVELVNNVKAGNYNLTAATFATTGKVTKAVTTLSIAAANAVYTGVAYDAANITKTSNVEDVVTYTYYSDAECTNEVTPINVGTYYVKGQIAETTNASAAEATASFQITKAALTVKANDHTIVYGEAPANNGVTYTGFVNGETESVLTAPVAYSYNYEQFGNVGTYVITVAEAAADNYAITFQTGVLTVGQKEVGLTWANAGTVYYTGKAQNVTATATGLVNDDEVAVTVVGGSKVNVGSYTAAASALTGAKAGNYKLPAAKTVAYEIVNALTTVTVTPATVSATIDGLTIKLAGYYAANETVKINGEEIGETLTVNGVEYTIDASAVTEMPANVDVTVDSNIDSSDVTTDDGVEESVKNAVLDALAGSPASEKLDAAIADVIADLPDALPEGATDATVAVEVILNIEAKEIGNNRLKLDITPAYQVTYTYNDAEGNPVVDAKEVTPIANKDIKGPVTVKVKVPAGFVPDYAKHDLGNGKFEYLTVTVVDGVATWQQSSFSEVELICDSRTVTVNYQFADGSGESVVYTAADINAALPTDSKSSHTFNGWNFTADETAPVYLTLTDELLTAMDGQTVTATAKFTKKNNGGNIGGGAVLPPVVEEPVNPFVDVNDSAYYYDAVLWAVEKGITNGMTETTFVPDAVCNRGQMVTFLWRAAGMPEPAATVNPFTDVSADAYYYKAVLWAVEKGITNGMTETTFAPGAACNRGQMATFLWRAAGKPVVSAKAQFADVAAGMYYTDAISWAAAKGITTGKTATTFVPAEGCTRGQMVTFLYRNEQKG